RFRFHNLGHLILLQQGLHFHCFDPVDQILRWELNLWEEGSPAYRSHVYNPADGSLRINYEGWTQHLPLGGLVSAEAVVLHSRGGVLGVHPLSGKVLWKRTGITEHLHLFHDGEHL